MRNLLFLLALCASCCVKSRPVRVIPPENQAAAAQFILEAIKAAKGNGAPPGREIDQFEEIALNLFGVPADEGDPHAAR